MSAVIKNSAILNLKKGENMLTSLIKAHRTMSYLIIRSQWKTSATTIHYIVTDKDRKKIYVFKEAETFSCSGLQHANEE